VRPRSPKVLPFFLPVIGLVALRGPARAVTIRLMESLPPLNVSAGGGTRLHYVARTGRHSNFTDCIIHLRFKGMHAL
jgi:hypothetical protein